MSTSRPWSAIPAARSSAPALRIKLYTTWAIMLLCMISGVVALVITLAHSSQKAPTPPAQISMTSATAQVVAADYLSGEATPVPVALGLCQSFQGQSADGTGSGCNAPTGAKYPYTALAFAGALQKTDNAVTYELDQFLVQTASGLSTLTVPMITTSSGPVLGAYPSMAATLLPKSYKSTPLQYQTDKGYSNTPQISPTLTSKLFKWAQAYAEGSQAGLQEVAQYTNQPVYPAMDPSSGFSVSSSSDVSVLSSVTTSSGLYLRLLVTLQGPGNISIPANFDVLVTGATTSDPRIISWGPAGGAPLAPFGS